MKKQDRTGEEEITNNCKMFVIITIFKWCCTDVNDFNMFFISMSVSLRSTDFRPVTIKLLIIVLDAAVVDVIM